MMMNIMDISNFINQKKDFMTVDKTFKGSNRQEFFKVLNNEKRNLFFDNQNNVKKSMHNNNQKNTHTSHKKNFENSSTKSFNEQSKISNKNTTKPISKETKKLDKYEDISIKKDAEISEDGLINNENIAILLQSILSMIEISKLDLCDETNNQLQNLERLREELSLLLDTTDVLLDESSKQNIETIIELINKISDEQLLVDQKQIDLQKQNINGIFSKMEDLKSHIEPILNKLNTIKVANLQNLDIKGNLLDLEEKQLVESDETSIHLIDAEKDQKTNIKAIDKFMSTDGEKDFSKKFEGDNEILFKEQILVSQQEIRDQSINLRIMKDQILEPKQFIDQIAQKAGAFLSKDRNEMSIRLTPENLGKISIKIGLNEGTLTGKIYTENYSVKEAIEANLNQLRDSLEEQGFNIAGLEVHIGDNPQNFEKDLYQSRFTDRQKSKVSSIKTNNNFVVLEESIAQTNPYLNINQFDSLV